MNFQLEEILTVIERVKEADLALFEYQDADARIKDSGETGNRRNSGRRVDTG